MNVFLSFCFLSIFLYISLSLSFFLSFFLSDILWQRCLKNLAQEINWRCHVASKHWRTLKGTEWGLGEREVKVKNFNWKPLYDYTRKCQCDQIWRNFANEEYFNSLWQFWKVIFSIWHNFEPTLKLFYAFGKISIDIGGQILNNNRAIWSHCRGIGEDATLIWPTWKRSGKPVILSITELHTTG